MQPVASEESKAGCCQGSEDRPTWALCSWFHPIAFAHAAPTVMVPCGLQTVTPVPCVHVRSQMYKLGCGDSASQGTLPVPSLEKEISRLLRLPYLSQWVEHHVIIMSSQSLGGGGRSSLATY